MPPKKELIATILILIATFTIVGVSNSQPSLNEKPLLTENLNQKAIEKQNKTKLIDTYGKTFTEVKSFNSYKQYKDITIINVTIKQGKTESYARIITNTKKFEEVLK